jgi:hypothetical protein
MLGECVRPLSAEDLHLLLVVFGEVPQLSQSGTAANKFAPFAVLSYFYLFCSVPVGSVFSFKVGLFWVFMHPLLSPFFFLTLSSSWHPVPLCSLLFSSHHYLRMFITLLHLKLLISLPRSRSLSLSDT